MENDFQFRMALAELVTVMRDPCVATLALPCTTESPPGSSGGCGPAGNPGSGVSSEPAASASASGRNRGARWRWTPGFGRRDEEALGSGFMAVPIRSQS
ncbi:MAG: hypothetical protein MUF16_19400 [Burkholderiaceae bacterium]|nr:hypothetical protein [Burkholderiaceae bacterium]